MEEKFRQVIRRYVINNQLGYSAKGNLEVLFNANPGLKEAVEKELKDVPWYKGSVKDLFFLVFKGVDGVQYCRTCGKELSVEAARRGSVYCSGGCKSKDPNRKDGDKKARECNEKIYEVDFSKPVSDDITGFFRLNRNHPSKEVEQKIRDFSGKDKKGVGLYNLLKNNKDVDCYFDMLVKVNPWMENKKTAYWFVKNGLYEGVKCPVCGKHLAFKQAKDGHGYCSCHCAQVDKDVREKAKHSCLERYGVENVMRSGQIKDRIKATMLERYGVDNISKLREYREKAEATTLERYGSRYFTQTGEYAEKTMATSRERYGTDWPAQAEESKQKAVATNIARYGVENVFANKDVKEKLIKKHRQYRYKAFVERYKKYVVPLFSEEEYTGFAGHSHYMWRCVKCGCEFEDHRRGTTGFRRCSSVPLCPTCYPPMLYSSFMEEKVFEFIKSIYGGTVIRHDRSVISPLELDIYVPDRQLAIEFDGLYWHSEEQGKDEYYHLNKTLACEKAGVRLIHIFEDEWIEKQDIVKDRIRSVLGIYDRRIYARKCVLKEIDAKTSNDFLNENHLQGGDHSSMRYGLFYDDELVSVMTFGEPRFNRNYDFELIRFASKLGVQLVGGASKLLVHFRRGHSGSIISYADRRYSQGRMYEALGFDKIAMSHPSYAYVKGNEKLSRYQCQKRNLAKVLGDGYDPALTEEENMTLNGYRKIYDCGNLVYGMAPDGNSSI